MSHVKLVFQSFFALLLGGLAALIYNDPNAFFDLGLIISAILSIFLSVVAILYIEKIDFETHSVIVPDNKSTESPLMFSEYAKTLGRNNFRFIMTEAEIILLEDGSVQAHLKVFMDYCRHVLDENYFIHFYTAKSRMHEKRFRDFIIELSQRNIPIVYTFTEESGNEEFWKERRKVEKEYKQFGENSPLVNAVGLFVGRKNNINALQAIIYKQDGSGKLMPFQTLDTTPAADGKTSNYYMTTATVENESVHSREMFNHAMAMLQSEVRSKAISERISSIRTWNDKHNNIFDFADKAVMPKTSKPDVINYPFGTSSNEQ